MSLVDGPGAQERAWREAERTTVGLMGGVNLAMAQLVATIRMLIDTEGWAGWGITSVEHWVTWKAGISRRRAGGLVRIARRIDELPECWGLFEAGRLTEDAMVRIARRVPAERDGEVAGWAPGYTISQLTRVLASCPELPDPDPNKEPRDPFKQRDFTLTHDSDGWGRGKLCLPPDEAARFQAGLDAAREAEWKDRLDLDPEEGLAGSPHVSSIDALLRMADDSADRNDATLARTGHRGERNKIVIHRDLGADGTWGAAQLHLGAVIPDSLARFLSCDAEVQVATYRNGQLLGINPTQRTVSRRLRRVIERRDQGCAHPLCDNKRWLHIHHIQHWEHGGLTVPENLVCLCQKHHRELHHDQLRIEGNPENRSLRFYGGFNMELIKPPRIGSPRHLRLDEPSPYQQPYGERLQTHMFGWNDLN